MKMRMWLATGAAVATLLGLGVHAARAGGNEMPIQWEHGHVGMDLGAPGQEVMFMTVHGHQCIVIGEKASADDSGSSTLSISCDWGTK